MVAFFLGRDLSRRCVDLAHDNCSASWCECSCHGATADLRRYRRANLTNPWRIVGPVAVLFAATAAVLLLVASGWRPW